VGDKDSERWTEREIKGALRAPERDEKALDGEREPGVERYLLIGPQESSI